MKPFFFQENDAHPKIILQHVNLESSYSENRFLSILLNNIVLY